MVVERIPQKWASDIESTSTVLGDSMPTHSWGSTSLWTRVWKTTAFQDEQRLFLSNHTSGYTITDTAHYNLCLRFGILKQQKSFVSILMVYTVLLTVSEKLSNCLKYVIDCTFKQSHLYIMPCWTFWEKIGLKLLEPGKQNQMVRISNKKSEWLRW